MPQPFRRPLKLNKSEQSLFDKYAYLVPWVCHRWARFRPNDTEELAQAARVGLMCAVKDASATHIRVFPAFARWIMNRRCRQFLWGKDLGQAAFQHARKHERSASEVIGTGEEGEYTLGQLAEDRHGRDELQAAHASDNLASKLFEMRTVLSSLPGLTRDERRLLKLRYVMGLEMKDVAQRIGWSYVKIKRMHRCAIGKLRTHFSERGALPPSAPLPADGNPHGCPR